MCFSRMAPPGYRSPSVESGMCVEAVLLVWPLVEILRLNVISLFPVINSILYGQIDGATPRLLGLQHWNQS